MCHVKEVGKEEERRTLDHGLQSQRWPAAVPEIATASGPDRKLGKLADALSRVERGTRQEVNERRSYVY